MSDIFAPLREPEPVASLAPEAVRRRGDRLRRRRAGMAVTGAVFATAIVVGGTTLLVGGRTGTDSLPEPVDSPTAQAVIPADFDLADGLSREQARSAGDAPALEICGESFSLADQAIATVGVGRADRGDYTIRGLMLYRDAGTARSVVTDLVATFENCPLYADGQGRDWTVSVRSTAVGDGGWVLGRVLEGSEPRWGFPEVIEVVRLGASLLVLSQREIHGVELEVLSRWTSDQVAWLTRRQMCLLTDGGCAWRSDPDVLRPDGWGAWRLGMSREEVEATGGAALGDSGTCTTADLGSGEGLLSKSDELVSLQVPEGVTTPEGIGVGSSRDEVLERYWFAEKNGDVILVRASPTADYEITTERGQVTQLTLSTVGVDCSG
jgi:hypothetical protein